MKLSRKRFVVLFVASGFLFVFLYNVAIRSVIRGRPDNSESFLGSNGLSGWRYAISTILYPVKVVLLGPVYPLLDLPDPPPPFVGLGFAIYWTILALLIYYIIGKIKQRRRHG